MAQDKKKKRQPWWAVKLPPWWVFPVVIAGMGLLMFILVSRYESSQNPAPAVRAVRYVGPQHVQPEGTEMTANLSPASVGYWFSSPKAAAANKKNLANDMAPEELKDLCEWNTKQDKIDLGIRSRDPHHTATGTLQRAVRGKQAMKQAQTAFQAQRAAAGTLQSALRGKQVRKDTARRDAAAETLQKWARETQVRKATARKEAAETLQGVVRGNQVRGANAKAVSDAQRTARNQSGMRTPEQVAADKLKMRKDLLAPDPEYVAAQQPQKQSLLQRAGAAAGEFANRTRRGAKNAALLSVPIVTTAAALASRIPVAGGPAPQSTVAQYLEGFSTPDQAPNPSATAVAIPATNTQPDSSLRWPQNMGVAFENIM